MGKDTGFLEIERATDAYAPIDERLQHYREFSIYPDNNAVSQQAARCMDCGIPFCQTGCPVCNIIPDWNDLSYQGDWLRAAEVLHSTNNFPEFTGRVCPAPCEAACTLNINDNAVAIKSIERAIIDNAWRQGWVTPQVAAKKSGKKVAVVGSGPAGLACAQQLARAGHAVEVLEKNETAGGLLRFGIPDFKMEKHLIDRRVQQMQEEGVVFKTNVVVGGAGDKHNGNSHNKRHDKQHLSAAELCKHFDAVVIAIGSEHPRDLPATGRDLDGVHFAMEFLPQQNRRCANLPVAAKDIIASGKHVVVIGGGDTGSDCIGTSNRQQAAQITQFELLAQPPMAEDKMAVWPHWPMKLRTSSSHDEGCDREWSIATKEFVGDASGRVCKLRAARVRWRQDNGKMTMEEMPDGEVEFRADLVLLAMGYVHPIHEGLLQELAVQFDPRGNIAANTQNYQTSAAGVFAAGDARRGQSLVVWAIREGRQCARAVDAFLGGHSYLPA